MFADKVWWITGASSGIGAALAEALSADGAKLILSGRNVGALKDVAGRCKTATLLLPFEATDFAGIAGHVEKAWSWQGRVDGLVNNAGWDRAANFLDTTPEFWRKIIAINLQGPLNVSHTVLRGMAARGFGRVVNVASDAGRVGSSGEAVYSACKGGVIAFSKTMAREMVSKGIIINTLCPGPTDTAILRSFVDGPDGSRILEGLKRAIPMRRLGEPEDYPGLVAFLLSDDAAYITGQTISVSGGLTMHG